MYGIMAQVFHQYSVTTLFIRKNVIVAVYLENWKHTNSKNWLDNLFNDLYGFDGTTYPLDCFTYKYEWDD